APELGSGRLTAQVTAAGLLVPRLTLTGPTGQVLIQSGAGAIVQHLQPGTYALTVSARSGTGSYQLTSQFVQTNQPLDPIRLGSAGAPCAVAVADLNGDGIPDLVVANYDTVSVLLGRGDGTFGPPQTVANGSNLKAVAVADLNGDGHPDLVVANAGDPSNPGN